ncbi:MAG TPA: 4-(cytidine 5'-diphospho)-2-C-methyl-D-erythritol kinase [Asticcacaulis sp.]|nr:4-(cytidine 5'-diphospho)-2-C-methyl-D-erythritol kinase [Asticcacaulis sp.]
MRLAPAKVNLYLHVGAPDARGYHPLQSLVMFADVGDEVRFLPALSNGSDEKLRVHLSVDGPFGGGLSNGEDNLILKAVRRFEMAAGVTVNGDFALDKNLPIASGIGGGSADAGAVLHLLRQAYVPEMADDVLASVAGAIGADGVMCLWSRSSFAAGYGEVLTPARLPSVPAVLINPLVECSTAAVYKGFDALDQFSPVTPAEGFERLKGVGDLVDALRRARNDLQAPAIQIAPAIADILQMLEAQSETLLARMSGSGATCFALCATPDEAQSLAVKLAAIYPAAWIKACTLS